MHNAQLMFGGMVGFSLFEISFDFSDWNDRRITRTTGQLEQPESRDEQQPERRE